MLCLLTDQFPGDFIAVFRMHMLRLALLQAAGEDDFRGIARVVVGMGIMFLQPADENLFHAKAAVGVGVTLALRDTAGQNRLGDIAAFIMLVLRVCVVTDKASLLGIAPIRVRVTLIFLQTAHVCRPLFIAVIGVDVPLGFDLAAFEYSRLSIACVRMNMQRLGQLTDQLPIFFVAVVTVGVLFKTAEGFFRRHRRHHRGEHAGDHHDRQQQGQNTIPHLTHAPFGAPLCNSLLHVVHLLSSLWWCFDKIIKIVLLLLNRSEPM